MFLNLNLKLKLNLQFFFNFNCYFSHNIMNPILDFFQLYILVKKLKVFNLEFQHLINRIIPLKISIKVRYSNL